MLIRNITNKINWIFDNLIPPILRDTKIFMRLWFWILFREKAKFFFEFKEKAPFLTVEEYEYYYFFLADKHIQRKTDLNRRSFQKILDSIVGESVLDVGCGKGFLAQKIAERKKIRVVGIDITIKDALKTCENPHFIHGNIEKLPFEDKSFDTVLCTHTLEHLLNPEKTINEIRRVSKKKIIIVVPRQREYKYTFDLHINFFPYIFSLQKLMKNPEAVSLIINNDIYYEEAIF